MYFKPRRAFSMLEMLVVVGILALLLTIAVGGYRALAGSSGNWMASVHSTASTLESGSPAAVSSPTRKLASFTPIRAACSRASVSACAEKSTPMRSVPASCAISSP